MLETVFIVLAIVVVLVVGFAAFMNNFEKKQYTAEIAGLRAEIAKIPGVGAQLSTLGQTPVSVVINHAPVTQTTGTPAASGGGFVTTTPVPAGMTKAADGVLLQPVTATELFTAFKAACAAASLAAGTYTNAFGSWNQFEWLRRMDAKTFAAWCVDALTVPGIGGGTAGYGWLTGLSADGAGFFLSLGAQTPPVVVPNVDPRA